MHHHFLFILGLYSAAIMLSGSSLNSWALTRSPLNFAKSVATSLKVNTKNITNMIEGLRRLPAEEIQKTTYSKFILVNQ